MTGSPIAKVEALDHVHLYVADRKTTVDWFRRVLGLLPFGSWRDDIANPAHPVFMGTGDGRFCLSLFPGKPPSDGERTVAFRVSAKGFLAFSDALPHAEIVARDGTPLRPEDAADHGAAFSHYFCDPDGNHLELTTYETEQVRAALGDIAAGRAP